MVSVLVEDMLVMQLRMEYFTLDFLYFKLLLELMECDYDIVAIF